MWPQGVAILGGKAKKMGQWWGEFAFQLFEQGHLRVYTIGKTDFRKSVWQSD